MTDLGNLTFLRLDGQKRGESLLSSCIVHYGGSKHGNWTYLEDAWPNLDTLHKHKVLAGERR